MGLYRGERVQLQGFRRSDDRLLVPRLKLERQGDKVTKINRETSPWPRYSAETRLTRRGGFALINANPPNAHNLGLTEI